MNAPLACAAADGHLRQFAQLLHALAIQLHLPEWGGKPIRLGQCETAHVHVMGGAEQHHAANAAAQRLQLRVGAGGDRTRIDIARMRHDQRLGRSRQRAPSGCASRSATVCSSTAGLSG